MPLAGYFLPTAAESTQRTPSKLMVLNSFARLGCRLYGKSSATRTGCAGSTPCFRMASASTSAGRSRGPALPWRGRDIPCVYRVAHNAPCHPFVGDDAYIVPVACTSCYASVGVTLAVARPVLHFTSCNCNLSLRGRSAPVAIRNPPHTAFLVTHPSSPPSKTNS